MIHVGIIGFGVVGSGVAEVLSMNAKKLENHLGQPLLLKRILDIREFPDSEYCDLITSDSNAFFADENISIIAETVGGIGIAYEYTKKALMSGKTVVTSNKELVSKHGVELMQMASDNHCAYIFEGAVGGGIPIIRPLHRCLAANRITRITGIVNGTTNYILTQMERNGTDFETALRMAQKKGYAEQNPYVDISGTDSQRKIAILGSIAMNGAYINPDSIHTEGITDIDSTDINYAKAMKSKIKLLVIFSNTDDMSAEVIVAPHLVANSNPICVADGVFNAIVVQGNVLGEAMFYGQGAGKLATASAVVGDILDGALHIGRDAHITPWYYSNNEVLSSFANRNVAVLIRVSAKTGIDTMRSAFPNISIKLANFAAENEAVYEVGRDGDLTEGFLANAICKLPGFISRIRIY